MATKCGTFTDVVALTSRRPHIHSSTTATNVGTTALTHACLKVENACENSHQRKYETSMQAVLSFDFQLSRILIHFGFDFFLDGGTCRLPFSIWVGFGSARLVSALERDFVTLSRVSSCFTFFAGLP